MFEFNFHSTAITIRCLFFSWESLKFEFPFHWLHFFTFYKLLRLRQKQNKTF